MYKTISKTAFSGQGQILGYRQTSGVALSSFTKTIPRQAHVKHAVPPDPPFCHRKLMTHAMQSIIIKLLLTITNT